MPIAKLKDMAIGYEASGEGMPVLFLHGLGADRRQSLSALALATGIRLVAPDMPGHGESPLAGQGGAPFVPSFAAYADLVLSLLDHLGISRAILGGTSMGAGIALAAALRRPEAVCGLLLVRPAWLDGPGLPHLAPVARLGRLMARCTPEEARREIEASDMFRTLAAAHPAAMAAMLDITASMDPAAAAAVLPALVDDRPFADLAAAGALRCPARVLWTGADPLHPPDLALRLAGAIPGAGLEELPPRYLEPRAYQEALAANLSRLETECQTR